MVDNDTEESDETFLFFICELFCQLLFFLTPCWFDIAVQDKTYTFNIP